MNIRTVVGLISTQLQRYGSRKEAVKMNIRTVVGLISTFALITAVGTAYAGAGASIYACVNMKTLVQPITFNFKAGAGSDTCMRNTGKNVDVTAGTVGVTCGYAGYVENVDPCIGADWPTWTLGYSVEGQNYSGTTQTHQRSYVWPGPNEMWLVNAPKGTVLCPQNKLCSSTSQRWDQGNVAPLYIIFQPQP